MNRKATITASEINSAGINSELPADHELAMLGSGIMDGTSARATLYRVSEGEWVLDTNADPVWSESTDMDDWVATLAQFDLLQEWINDQPTLSALRNALNAYDPDDEDAPKLDEIVDLTNLPTFGGNEPADTSGIWSWDSERLLVDDVSGRYRFAIERR